MSFFISDALAAPAEAAAPGMEGMVFPAAILIFFYFLFIRPQSKRTKEQKEMLKALTKGTEVVTTGGVLGKVAEVDDNFVKLEVGDNHYLQIQRHAIGNMMPKGTFKAVSKKTSGSTKKS